MLKNIILVLSFSMLFFSVKSKLIKLGSDKSSTKVYFLSNGVKYEYTPFRSGHNFNGTDLDNKIKGLQKEIKAIRNLYFSNISSIDNTISQENQPEYSFSDFKTAEIKTESIAIDSVKNFEDIVCNADEKKAVLVKIIDPGSSELIDLRFNELSFKYKDKILFVSVDAFQFLELVERYKADFLPAFLYFQGGVLIDKIDGGSLESLELFVSKIIS